MLAALQQTEIVDCEDKQNRTNSAFPLLNNFYV